MHDRGRYLGLTGYPAGTGRGDALSGDHPEGSGNQLLASLYCRDVRHGRSITGVNTVDG